MFEFESGLFPSLFRICFQMQKVNLNVSAKIRSLIERATSIYMPGRVDSLAHFILVFLASGIVSLEHVFTVELANECYYELMKNYWLEVFSRLTYSIRYNYHFNFQFNSYSCQTKTTLVL